jgi:hypothetical protein
LEPRLLLSADLNVLDDGGLNDYFDHVQISTPTFSRRPSR